MDGSTAGNTINGAGLGGTGTWDTSASNWWDQTNLGAWPNLTTDTAVFGGTAGVVTVSSGISTNRISFRSSGYSLTGGDITLGGTTPTIRTNLGETATIGSQLLGSAGLTVTGNGTLRLANNSNSYTGTTTISGGSVVINNQGALGADTSAVVVSGSATRGFGGGSLVLDGLASGMTFSRALSIQGLGPIADRSGALVSVGNNTVSGAITVGATPALATTTRITSTAGLLTLSGGVDAPGTAGTNFLQIGHTQGTGAGMTAITGALTGTGTLEKTGVGTLFLTPSSTSGFSGTLRVSASAASSQSSVRITSNGVLGTRTSTGTGSVIEMNGGILEVLMDAPVVQSGATPANAPSYVRGSSTTFLDHAPGSTVTGGTLTLGARAFDANLTDTFTARNGYNITIPAFTVNTASNSSTITNNLAGGTLSITGNFWNTADGTSRSMTIGGNGNTTISGNVLGVSATAGVDHSLTKSGTGILQITSTGATLDGNLNISGGTVQITDFRSVNMGSASTTNNGTINIGTTTTAGVLTIGTATAATAAGLTLLAAKNINLAGTTGGATINANQSVALPVTLGGFAASGINVKSLTLGGTSTQDNVINGAIINNATGQTQTSASYSSGATTITLASVEGINVGDTISGTGISTTVFAVNTTTKVVTLTAAATAGGTSPVTITTPNVQNPTSLVKTDAGTWVLAGTNTYTGSTTISGGTLKLNANAAASTILADVSAPTFNANTTTGFAGGTLQFKGVNGSATTETLGALTPTAGAGTVTLVSGGGGAAANLTFASLGATAAASSVNFNTSGSGGGVVTLTGQAATTATTLPGTANFLGHLYIDGADFAAINASAQVFQPVYASTAGFVNGGAALTAANHNLVNVAIASQAAVSVTSLKMTTNNLTMAGNLTLATGALLQTGGSATIDGTASGKLILGGAAATNIAIRVDGVSDVLNINSNVNIGSAQTGGFTKNGAGKLVISGTNAQTGATTINEGTVQLTGASSRISATSASLVMRQGSTLEFNGTTAANATVANLDGNGTITNVNASPVTLTISGSTNAFGGVMQDGAGVFNLTKGGTTGTATLIGLNTYTGVTTIAGSTGLISTPNIANIGVASGIGKGNTGSNAASLVLSATSTGGLNYTGVVAASTDRLFTLNSGTAGGGGQIANSSATNAPLSFTNTGAIAFGAAAATVAQTLTLAGASTADNVFAPQLTNNAALATAVTKIGAGNWVLTGANSYTGTTSVGTGTTAGGTLQATDGVGLPSNSPLLLAAGTTGGGVFQTSGDFVRNLVATPVVGTGTVTVGSTTSTSGGIGFSAVGGKLTVAFGGLGTPTALTWGSGGFMGVTGTNTGAFVLNGALSTHEIEVQNAINLNGGSRTIQVDDNGNTGADFATITGAISNASGTGNLVKTGGGILQLRGANTYNGTTTVSVGTLSVSSLGNSATPGATSVGAASNAATSAILIGNATTGGAILEYVGTGETSDRMIRFNSTTGGPQIHASGSGALVLTNVDTTIASPTGAKTLSLRGTSSAGNTITSNLSNDGGGGVLTVTLDGGATWILSGNNAFTGNLNANAGAFGLGSNTAAGASTLSISNGTVFAANADRSIANNVTIPNQAAATFIGDYSITTSGNLNNASAANSNSMANTLAAGKTLTFNTMSSNAISGDRTFTISGTGDTTFTGAITTTAAFNLNIQNVGTGTLTLAGTGSTFWNNPSTTASGNMTFTAGSLKLGANDVIPNGNGSGANGHLVFNPATGVTTTFDLNGFSDTINGLTANAAGNVVITNTAAGASTLTVGDTAMGSVGTVTFGGGAGSAFITQPNGTINLAKVGSSTANFTGTLGNTGSTTVNGGVLNYNSPTGTTSLNVGTGGTLNVKAGLSTPASVTSVTVAGGGSLSLADGTGTPIDNLTSLSLGLGTGTATLELEAGDLGTDTLTLLNPNVATTANTINLLVKDFDITSGNTYDLLVAPGGGLLTGGGSSGAYTFSLAGYSGSTLFQSDNLVSITAGTLITSDVYWNGGTSPATTAWNTIDGLGNTNFSTNLAGTVQATTLPGKGQKVIVQADNLTGGAALSTTLDQPFKINALEFRQSTTPADTARSVTIASGTGTNSLTLVPSLSTDGINLQTGATPLVNISAPVVAGLAQTWTTADSVSLTGGTSTTTTSIAVANTAGLRPGMTITGNGIPAGTTIVSVDSATGLTLSAATTAATGQTYYAAQQLNISGGLSGSANVTKAGPGKLVISAASTGYTGTFGVSGGIAEATLATALGGVGATANSGATISINSGGTFYYNNATADTGVGALNFPNPITLNGGTLSAGGNARFYSGNVNVSADSSINLRDLANATTSTTARNTTLTGTISGAGGIALDSIDTAATGNQLAGTLTINNGASTWNGPLTVNRGTVVFTNAANTGTATPYVGYNGNVNFNQFGRVIFRNVDGGSLTRTATLNYAAGATGEFSVDNLGALASNYTVTQSGAMNLNSGSIVRFNMADAASNLILTGGVVLNGNASITAAGGDADSFVTISGTGISGTGNLAINDEAGAWGATSTRIAINAAGTYSGNTTLNEGTLILGHKDALSTGSLTITAASSIEAGVNLSASGSGPVPNVLNLGATLTTSGTNNLSFSGLVTNSVDADRTLTNNITSPAELVLGGTTFNLTTSASTTARTLTLNGTGNTTINAAMVNNGTGASKIVKSGAGTLTLGGANTFTGGTTINQGTIKTTANDVLPNTGTITVNATVAGTALLDLNGNSDTIAALNLGGTGGLVTSVNQVSTGAGTLTLGGNVTVANNGNWTSSASISGNVALGSATRTFTIGDSTGTVVDLDLQAIVSGSAVGITKNGAGLMQLSAANTYTGATTINLGTIRYGANNAINSASAVTVNSTTAGATAVLDLNNFSGTIASLTIGGTSQTATSASVIQTGTGTLTLGGNVATSATGNPTTTPLITGNLALGSATRTFTVADSTGSAVDLDIQAVVSGTGVGITKAGAGVLVLSNVNTYTGATTISPGASASLGVIRATASNAFGTGAVTSVFTTGATTGQIQLSGGITLGNSSFTTSGLGSDGTSSGVIRSVSGANIISGAINMTGGGGASTYRADTGASLTVNGNVGGIGAQTARIVNLVGGGDFVFNGIIRNSNDATASTVGVNSANTGTTTLNGTNTYTLATTVGVGSTLIAGSTQAFGVGSPTTVDGTLRLAGFSNSVGSLAGAGAVENANASAATLSSPDFSGFTGLIQDGTGGSLSITKTGTSASTLAGTNTFSGKTTIANGTLSVATVDATATASQPLGTHTDLDLGVAATSSGKFLYTGAAATFGKNINAQGNGTDTVQNGGSGLLTLSGTITKNGTTLYSMGGGSGILITGSVVGGAAASDLVITGGTTTLAGNNSYNGPTILQPTGTLVINHAHAISDQALVIDGGTLDNTSGSAITLSTNNPLTINADFTFTGTNSLNLGTGAVTLDANRTVTVSANTLTIGGVISGAFNLVGTGGGTLALTGASTYTGTTTAQTGTTIAVGGNGSLGGISSGTIINTGAALQLNGVSYTDAEPLALNGSGLGGNGALSSTGTSSFAGPITIVTDATIGAGGGTLSLSGGIDKTGTVLTLGGGGTINIGGSGITGNTGSPNSDLVVDATTVNLNTASSYNGPTYIINGGVINANVSDALPTTIARTVLTMDATGAGSSVLGLAASQAVASLSGAATSSVTLGANTLTIGTGSGATTFAGVISGSSGVLVKDGASTQILTNENTYSGSTTVSNGTLQVDNTTGSGTGSGPVTVMNGAILSGTGTISGDTTIRSGAQLQAGTSTIIGTLTFGNSLALLDGSTTDFHLASDSSFDKILTSNLQVGMGISASSTALFRVLLDGAYSPLLGASFKILDWSGSLSGVDTNLADNLDLSNASLGSGLGWDTSSFHSSGIISVISVPEPSRALLLMLGLLGFGLRRRRSVVSK